MNTARWFESSPLRPQRPECSRLPMEKLITQSMSRPERTCFCLPRVFLIAAALLLGPALAALGQTPARRDSDDWPGFLGPLGNGVSAETGLLARWPEQGPPVLWKKTVGAGYAAPSVLGDRLVFFHRLADEEVVECINPETGETRWRFASPTRFADPYGYNGGPRCSPVLTATRCFTFGAEGKLTCLDIATGAKIWQRDTAKDFDIPQAFFGVGSTPVFHGGRLLVMLGGQPRSGVVAFDAATGKTCWESVGTGDFPDPPVRIQRDRPPAKLASYASPLVTTIHGKQHLLCFLRPGLVSLDPETGSIRFSVWCRSTLHDSVNAACPVVLGDQIFLSAAYDTGAMLLQVAPDGRSADVVWQDGDAMQTHWSTAIEHRGYLYGFSGRNEAGADLRCIRAQDGKMMWRSPAEPAFYGRGSALLADGHLIVMGERGTLALVKLDPESFREISRVKFAEFDHPCWTAPVLSRKRLFITGARQIPGPGGFSRDEYHLVCLDLAAD